jgi:PKD repeat protein
MKKLILILALLMLCGVASAVNITPSYWNNTTTYYINGSSSGTLTNYPVMLTVYNTTGISSGSNFYLGGAYVQPIWNDIRFSADNATELPYWMETATNTSTSATFWINMSSITGGAGNQTNLYIYYGNATVGSNSNGNTTFPFFDDFPTTTLNPQWTSSSGATISNGIVNITGTSSQIIGPAYTYNTAYRSYSSLQNTGNCNIGQSNATAWILFQGNSPTGSVINWRTAFATTETAGTVGVFNGYHIYEYKRNSTKSIFFEIDNILKNTSSTNIVNGPINVKSSASSGVVVLQDWIALRPYYSTEPSLTPNGTPPVANITANVTSGVATLNVQFTGVSTGGEATSWNWSFGDGTANSTSQSPLHQYTTGGIYNVSLTVTNAFGSNTTTKTNYIKVLATNFTGTPTTGTAPLSVAFNDTSTPYGNATTWAWNFGDGQQSTLQNITHVYTSAGSYNVTLNVTTDFTTGTKTATNYITVSNLAPAANFYGVPAWGSSPLDVSFYDISTNGTATSWEWQWGDGTANGTTQNPTHQYTANGEYSVNMTATNAIGSSTKQRLAYIKVGTTGGGGGAMEAIFRSNTTGGIYPLPVQFTDLSTGGPETWNWSWGDATANGTTQNPIHTYTGAGSYTVTLTVTNATQTPNSSTSSATNFIVVANTGSPVSNFYADSTWGINYVNASFHDISTGGAATSWNWSMGDGTYNTTQNPVKNYTTIGTYTVSLNATNIEGSTVRTRTDYIQVSDGKPETSFYGMPTTGPRPLTVQFTDTSGNTPTSWQWNFGDGTSNATTQNPSHQYTGTGTYTVILTATNAYGSNTRSVVDYIVTTETPPVASFYGVPTTGTVSFNVQFTDTSSNTPTSWAWNFGDGTANATTQNPLHSYTVAGTYSVILTATNAYGSNSYKITDMIQANAPSGSPPTAAFSGTPTTGPYPLTVTFTDGSSGSPVAWYWDFGDSGTSTLQSPSHIYTTDGVFTVAMRATNLDGTDWENKTGYITSSVPTPTPTPTPATSPPACSFRSNITGAPSYPCTVQFNQTCTGNPTSFNWSFGDGTTSTEENPNHTYTDQGYFTVYLNATNAYGTGETQKENYFHIIQHYVRPTVSTTIAPIGTRGYGLILDSFGVNKSPANETEAKTNWTMLAFGSVAPFMDTLGPLFPLLIIAIPFLLIWLATRDLTLPCIVGILICPFLIVMLPSQWHIIAAIGIGLGITAVIYTILTRRE